MTIVYVEVEVDLSTISVADLREELEERQAEFIEDLNLEPLFLAHQRGDTDAIMRLSREVAMHATGRITAMSDFSYLRADIALAMHGDPALHRILAIIDRHELEKVKIKLNQGPMPPSHENPEFNAWVASLPPRSWAHYDLSACRLGWEAAYAAAIEDAVKICDKRHETAWALYRKSRTGYDEGCTDAWGIAAAAIRSIGSGE